MISVSEGVFVLCWGSLEGFPPVVWAVAVLELEPQDTSGQQTTESVSS